MLRAASTAMVIGMAVGALACALGIVVDAASSGFLRWPWLAFLLPLAGVASLAWYRLLHVSFDENTSSVIEATCQSEPVPAALAPAVFVGTCLTVACGGSVGKEAAALQMGGGVASALGDRLGPRQEDYRETFIMCGLAAALSAVLHTPLAAFLFAVEVMHRRFCHPLRLAAVALSSFVSYLVAHWLLGAWTYSPSTGFVGGDVDLCAAAVLGVLAAVVGGSFCVLLKISRRILRRFSPSPFVRVLVGGVLVAILVSAVGMSPYSGTGISQITATLSGESVADVAFLGKFVLTVLTLSFGFKGGEVMPVLCIGACLGATLSGVVHADSAALAALGMVALFSACSNCPLASFAMGVELFGVGIGPGCAVVTVVSFICSYRCSLFPSSCITWMPRDLVRRVRTHHGRKGRRDGSSSHDA